MKNVVAIMAHPDDEVLGCGATLSRFAREGCNTHILILATGLTSRGNVDIKQIRDLQDEAKSAARCLGAKSISFENFPDNKMDTIPLLEIIKKVENFIYSKSPDIIFTHHSGDLNIDHQITQRSVLTATRSLPGSKNREIYATEILSSTEFNNPENRIRPDCYFTVSKKDVNASLKALACYKSEIRISPHPRSIEIMKSHLNVRGSECGFEYAECFEVLKIVK